MPGQRRTYRLPRQPSTLTRRPPESGPPQLVWRHLSHLATHRHQLRAPGPESSANLSQRLEPARSCDAEYRPRTARYDGFPDIPGELIDKFVDHEPLRPMVGHLVQQSFRLVPREG